MSETWNKPGCILSHFREERFDIDLSCSSPSEEGWGSSCWRSHWSLCLSRRARSWLCLHRSVLPPETALADSNPWTILAARSFPSRSVTKTATIIRSIDEVSQLLMFGCFAHGRKNPRCYSGRIPPIKTLKIFASRWIAACNQHQEIFNSQSFRLFLRSTRKQLMQNWSPWAIQVLARLDPSREDLVGALEPKLHSTRAPAKFEVVHLWFTEKLSITSCVIYSYCQMVCKIITEELSFWNGIHACSTEVMLTNEVAGYLSIAEPARG